MLYSVVAIPRPASMSALSLQDGYQAGPATSCTRSRMRRRTCSCSGRRSRRRAAPRARPTCSRTATPTSGGPPSRQGSPLNLNLNLELNLEPGRPTYSRTATPTSGGPPSRQGSPLIRSKTQSNSQPETETMTKLQDLTKAFSGAAALRRGTQCSFPVACTQRGSSQPSGRLA